jgi:hypothetical protein
MFASPIDYTNVASFTVGANATPAVGAPVADGIP